MAKSKKQLETELRNEWISKVGEWLKSVGEEDVMLAASNTLIFPTTDSERNDKFVKIVISIPTGAKDEGFYDGYGIAQQYAQKVADNEAKAKVEAEKKARKIAKDKAQREAKAKAKAEREAEKG